jgi:hypothetical protein
VREGDVTGVVCDQGSEIPDPDSCA